MRIAKSCSLLMLLALSGCVESSATRQREPFEVQELDGCLAILIDMSGSFADSWEDQAYELFVDLSEAYFSEAMGTENRLVIAQLSASDNVVLFEGRPADLQQRFRSPAELVEFLKQKSDSSSSRVYESIDVTVEYVMGINGVTDNTRLMTVVLSDLRDSESDWQRRSTTGRKMIETLRAYRETGGGLALYFVAADETPRWNKILDEAGFETGHYIIENALTSTPQLPRFD